MGLHGRHGVAEHHHLIAERAGIEHGGAHAPVGGQARDEETTRAHRVELAL
jgi:hypothetical protein